MLFDLSSLLWLGLLGNYEVVNDNPLADATALIVFPNRPGGVGRVGRGNEKTAPETSVPRGPPPPPPRCPSSTGPLEIVRMYVRTSSVVAVFIVSSVREQRRRYCGDRSSESFSFDFHCPVSMRRAWDNNDTAR